MRKIVLALSAFGMISFASCKGGGSGDIVNQWKVTVDKSEIAQRDSIYNEQLKSIDTMTTFPEDIMNMKKEMAKMPKDSLATLPAELVELLSINDIEAFKTKMKSTSEEMKRSEDSMIANRVVVFDFEKSGVLKRFASDDPSKADTSTMYHYDKSKKKIYMFGNPALFKDERAKDSVVFEVIYLSGDSMSLKIDPTSTKNPQPTMKPMNFKRYEGAKKAK